jgi:hypothetical protein
MAKSKLGLQKEVSKIFTGIQIPQKNAAGPDASSTAPTSPITSHTQAASAATPAPVATSTTVPAVTAPISALPAPVATPANTVTPKPAVVSPKPFTVPEPPIQATSQPTRQVVYEPPKPRQTTFEPPSAPVPVSVPAKQSKFEFVIKQLKDSPLLKIIEKVKAKLLTSKQGVAPGRQKIILLLSPVLAIVFLIVVVNAVKTSPGISVNPSNKETAAVAPVFGSKISWEIPQPIPANLRNPMVFGAVSASGSGTAGGPVVKGIVYSEDKSSAIIGDRIVSAGDTVAGATVVKINPNSVDFAAGDKKWTQKVER